MPAVDSLVCFALYAASRTTTQAYRVLLDPWDLTYPQYLALVTLWNDGDQTVSGLGDALQLDSGTLSPMLARMETAGYVTRERRADDERVVTVSLTARGREMRDELAHVPRCIAVGSGIPDADSAHELIRALQQLTVAMRDLRDHPRTVLDVVTGTTRA
ncbi:MAG: MarR family transcriptional regulator [Microbacterium sp. 71-36]|uniref:MarR family winged helix-turn-helix transcriptional regulator n=1 Tax=unclassified Microbacterium TaxID=2609290 RepID=UPI00086B52BA|nr:MULTISPECIES: MarR family transcriptional regulator [unclassified Microbacterium]MBN9209994.1 MarR family transcriptional regulator [Microbacterium sp.]ODT39138.1 MAG: MarR family transcriptional regulator [Microbacterium sp. SCN 71-17]OJV74792.1 MAG: MarR family transcriptional regulator [Microbacterium sp. 71-36]SIR76248.1 DNA-binding transcriptional regulator, MarR family [Microbacterium sp. RURRCA19A]